MSLHKQLWLAIILLLGIVFSVSFAVTTLSAKIYLQEQLSMKNADNATALALSLSQQDADNVMLELTLSAQFDTGFYEMIELIKPQGHTSIRRIDDDPIDGAPGWFVEMLPIEAKPGVASIQSGWQQVGTLTVLSHSKFAYQELWQTTVNLAIVFIISCLLAGFLGRMVLKSILKPLESMVDQADAIKERRFITTAEPRTLEFKQLVASMNSMSEHVKSTLSQEATRLQKWEQEVHQDKVTGLRNREPFIRDLQTALTAQDAGASGSLALIRLTNLALLNQNFGRHSIDSLLRDVGKVLARLAMRGDGWSAGRLNGSDFALLAPGEMDAAELGQLARTAMARALEKHGLAEHCQLPGAAINYKHQDKLAEVLSSLDRALTSAQEHKSETVAIAHKGDVAMKPVREQMLEWRDILDTAMTRNLFDLSSYPVLNPLGEPLHFEAPVYLNWEDKKLRAGQFLPWVSRLQLSAELDRRVVELALANIDERQQPLAINLTVAAIADDSFLPWLEQMLNKKNQSAEKLWLEIPESLTFRHLENFKQLCARVKRYGTKIGIEHVGHQLAELGKLHDVGVDYLKVDASFVRNIQDNPANQTLISALTALGHAIGVIVIAEGVETEAEWAKLKDLGMDGATGTGIQLASSAGTIG